MSEIVYLNGEFKPAAQASISIYDRSVLFGDSVYEVIPVYDGRPFALDFHFQRLCNSLQSIHMPEVLTLEAWQALTLALLEKNDYQQQCCLVYTQISRGCTLSRAHKIPENIRPTIIMFT